MKSRTRANLALQRRRSVAVAINAPRGRRRWLVRPRYLGCYKEGLLNGLLTEVADSAGALHQRRAHLDAPTGARAVPARSTSLGRGGLEHS